MKRFKVLSFMSVFLLLFAGVALAQNADNIFVEVSYPCIDGGECDTGQAVSRCDDGDVVNVYVTLKAGEAVATAGPNGELLSSLTATVSSTLGNIQPNGFAADAQTIAFSGDATARANINYTSAVPGVDQVIVTVSSEPEALVGQASVNVVAPPAGQLVVRTLRSALPPQNIYDPIPDQANNGAADEPAGFAVPVTVIADEDDCDPLFTPDGALEGQQVTVMAYADYDEDGVAGGGVASGDIADGFESTAIGEATFTMIGGIASGTVQINSAGPDGLNVVFTASAMTAGTTPNSVGSTQMGPAGVDLSDPTVDTVLMNPLAADRLLIGMDPYGNGNLIVEDDCFRVLDDANFGAGTGTPTPLLVTRVDTLGNAVRDDAQAIMGDLGEGSILDDQLDFVCVDDVIDSGDYAEACELVDTENLPANSVIQAPLTVSAPMLAQDALASDAVAVDLLPAAAANVADVELTTDAEGLSIEAGDTVVLTLDWAGTYGAVVNGDILEISARNIALGGALQLISLASDDVGSADTMLTVAADDADEEADGIQIELKIYGPCTVAPDQEVLFFVKNTSRCDLLSTTAATIQDVDPGPAANLAVVDLVVGTDSDLDDPLYVGTEPIVGTTPLIADGSTSSAILDCGDVEVRDEFENVLDATPVLACTSGSGLGILTVAGDCNLSGVWVTAAADTVDTLTCEATDYPDVDSRSVTVPLVAEEEEAVPDEATAIVIQQEGPQTQAGVQTNPCGEAIIQIFANGPLSASKNVEIFFGDASIEGLELRTLTSNTPLPIPFAVTLNNGDVKRYVVYGPGAGSVEVQAVDLGNEPLIPGELRLANCDVGGTGELEVTVTCGASDLCDGDPCTTCTAVTAPGMMQIEGTYSWEINGVAAGTGGTMGGNTLEVCPEDLEDGSNTITATDTANGDIEGSATIGLNGPDCEEACVIDVLSDSFMKGIIYARYPVLIRIETLGIEGLNAFTPVTIDCDADGTSPLFKSVLKTGKWIQPSFGTNTTVIWQTALIFPQWWTQTLGEGPETCTVTVEGCAATDTFELEYVSFGQ